MELVQKISSLIEPSLDAMGYTLVQIKLSDQVRRKTLIVMAERKDDVPMGFDDCTEISQTVGALLEVEDPITTAYDLEVCSPGLDRPLTKSADFKKYCGQEAKIELFVPLAGGQRRFRGRIHEAGDERINVLIQAGAVDIEISNIRTAKLIGTLPETATSKPKPGKHKKHATH